MPSAFAAAKALARRTVHDTMSVAATYIDQALPMAVSLRVRWHNKIVQGGDLENQGYAQVITSYDRVIFDRDELAVFGTIIQRGGKVTITEPGYDNQLLLIDERDPLAGPLTEAWIVSKV